MKRAIRILHIGKYYPPEYGGIETVTRNLVTATNASPRPFRADVFCFSRHLKSSRQAADGGTVYRVAASGHVGSTPLSIWYIVRLAFLAIRYDVLHVHLPNPFALAGLLLVPKRVPIVLHWHSDVVNQRAFRGVYHMLLVLLSSRVSLVIGATPFHTEFSDVVRYLRGVPKLVLPYFLPKVRRAERPSARLRGEITRIVESTCFVVFALGRLVAYKGLEFLIEAARELDERYLIVIAGNGPKREELVRHAERVGPQVVMTGSLADSEVEALFSRASVFVLPSVNRAEMFGMVQIEAFRSGVPVVSTNIDRSGTAYVNRDGETGFVVPTMNSKALAIAVRSVCENPLLHSRMSRLARERFNAHFSEEVVMQHYFAAYESVLRPS